MRRGIVVPGAIKEQIAMSVQEIKGDTTLSKGLMILEWLAQSGSPKGVTEVARELNLTKSNVFRILQTLAHLGYVHQSDAKRYAATAKSWQIGCRWVENLNVRAHAATDMQRLSRETDETVYLAIREGLTVIYIDKLEGRKQVRSWNPIGGSAPIHCLALGKALLAEEFDLLRPMLAEPLPRFTDGTLTTISELEADARTTRELGYSVDRGEFREQTLSFAAAIRDGHGRAIASIGLSIPQANPVEATERELGELVSNAARSITQKIAGPNS